MEGGGGFSYILYIYENYIFFGGGGFSSTTKS